MAYKSSEHKKTLDILLEYSKAHGSALEIKDGGAIFTQGDAARTVYYIVKGQIRLSVVSSSGKEAIIGIAEENSFIGENCFIGHPVRLTSAIAMTDCELLCFEKINLLQLLHTNPKLSDMFIEHLVTRAARMEEDIVDHIFNTSEKRLARALLHLAHFGSGDAPKPIQPKISHEMLAEMIGTTRPRVTQFMNKFRKLGFIDYNDTIKVHNSLLSVLLKDDEKS